MHKRFLTVTLSASFMSGCSSLAMNADSEIGDLKAGEGYLADFNGNIIKSGSGECIRSQSWSQANIINRCEGLEESVAEPETQEKEEPELVGTKPDEADPVTDEVDDSPVIETVELSSRALFSTNADSLTAQGDQAMKNLVAKLGEYAEIEKVEIIGHTDSRGAEAYNMELSKRRADTIKQFIVGVYSETEINVLAKGESEPVASNDTASGRQQNRRVEIRVIAKMVVDKSTV